MDKAEQPPQVRDAASADAEALARVFVEAWRAEHAGLLPPEVLAARSAAESAANWRRTLDGIATGHRTDRFVLAALRGALLVGLVVATQQAAERPPGEGEVILIQVADGHRSGGVGTAMMRAAARRMAALGARSVIVRVLETNVAARRFYERLGGQLTSETRSVEESGLHFPERLYRWAGLDTFR